ncbi:hypothetical protein LCGC14_2024460 [marine sediment metagenome]|uniref:DUF3761 domain-containing protein n=1 Tax=marine sediment metagenome TaxID=412755 RepID=A0A0F9FJ20_9ZZZZ
MKHIRLWTFMVAAALMLSLNTIGCSKDNSSTAPTEGRQRIGAVCNDGTQSSATGSGACSSHGGVNHWLYKD